VEILSAPIKHYLEAQRTIVDHELDRLLPSADEYPPSIHQAMRHSVLAGGKRLRPILCLEAGRLFHGGEAGLLRVGSALEFVHTYSLIHDDLPALDNDDLRRGQPTCHRVFGEATAILAGDALLTLAFHVLSSLELASVERQLRVIHELSGAIGTRAGMVGGQVVDLETDGQGASAATLEYIHCAKTGALIRAAVRSGAIYADAEEADLERITVFGEKIGLAFQIADDLLDVLASKDTLGKSTGKDNQQNKATYPGRHGIQASQRIAAALVGEACAALQPYGTPALRLQDIAHYLIERNF